MNVLELVKVGCDFFDDDERVKNSDLSNYRYFIHNIDLKPEILEKYNIDTNSKLRTLEISRTDENIIKNNKIIVLNECKTWINFYFYDNKNNCFSSRFLETDVNKNKIDYDKNSILKFINRISNIKYDYILEKENN